MAIYYPLIIYAFVTTFTPGPNNILSMSHAMQSGYRRTLGFMLGVFTGMAIILAICGLLNVALVSVLPKVQHWLIILGAVYMGYLGVHTLLSKPTENGNSRPATNSFLAGVALQFLNLKVILYGITIYSLYITRLFTQPYAIVLSAILLAGLGLIATSSWAIGGTLFRAYWQKHYRIFNLVMGGLLIYLAVHSLIN